MCTRSCRYTVYRSKPRPVDGNVVGRIAGVVVIHISCWRGWIGRVDHDARVPIPLEATASDYVSP